jgi:integrase
MPRNARPIYERGHLWLDWDRKRDGSLRTPYLTIFRYDAAAKRVRSRSTGETAHEAGKRALDRQYAADAGEAPPVYCPTCGQTIASAARYLLADAIAAYLDATTDRPSIDSLRARLNHVLDYLEDAGLEETVCADVDDEWVRRFRTWSAARPVEWRNGQGAVTVSRPRSPATTEESVINLKTALNHAFRSKPPRIEHAPTFETFGRKKVSRARTVRIDTHALADMVGYAFDSSRRKTLQRFLVAGICTLARPDAIFDIDVAPKRRQWTRDSTVLDLNPHGRVQTDKHRPIVPVRPWLAGHLTAALDAFEKGTEQDPVPSAFVTYAGEPVDSIKTAWRTMLQALKLPVVDDYMPYVLRRSMATILREAGVDPWQLAGQMGHRLLDTTEIYALHSPSYLGSVQLAIEDVVGQILERVPEALHRKVRCEEKPQTRHLVAV